MGCFRRDSANSNVSVAEVSAMKGRGTEEYNELQCKEIVLACTVLRGIVDISRVHDWERKNGRPRIARRDIVLCLLVKTYLNVSYRRLTVLLRVLRPYFVNCVALQHTCGIQQDAFHGGRNLSLSTLQRVYGRRSRPSRLTHLACSYTAQARGGAAGTGKGGRITARYMCFQAQIR